MAFEGEVTLISVGSVAFLFFLALVISSPQGEEAERLAQKYPKRGGNKTKKCR